LRFSDKRARLQSWALFFSYIERYYGEMISRADIEDLARLSRLKLSEDEMAGLEKDFASILDYVGQIDTAAVDLGAPEVPALRNVMRGDVPRVADDPLAHKEESLLAAAPRREGDSFVVRTILSKDEPSL